MPCGKTVVANQVLNSDLFWAMRGVSRDPQVQHHHELTAVYIGWRSDIRRNDIGFAQDIH